MAISQSAVIPCFLSRVTNLSQRNAQSSFEICGKRISTISKSPVQLQANQNPIHNLNHQVSLVPRQTRIHSQDPLAMRSTKRLSLTLMIQESLEMSPRRNRFYRSAVNSSTLVDSHYCYRCIECDHHNEFNREGLYCPSCFSTYHVDCMIENGNCIICGFSD